MRGLFIGCSENQRFVIRDLPHIMRRFMAQHLKACCQRPVHLYPCLIKLNWLAPIMPLPDAQSCTTGEVYFNPALRLSVSHKDLEWSPEIDNFTKFCIDSRLVESVFKGNPLFQDRERSQRVFLFRLVQQVRLAINSGALLIGDNFFEAVYRKV